MTSLQEEKYKSVGKRIGSELYPALNEDHQAIIAFGMTPKELIDIFQEETRHKLAKLEVKRLALADDPQTLQALAESTYPDVINAYTNGFVLGLMDGATKANKMIA